MDITELQNNSSLAIFKPYNRLLKRMLDVLVSSVFLVCVYPWVYIVVACCISMFTMLAMLKWLERVAK